MDVRLRFSERVSLLRRTLRIVTAMALCLCFSGVALGQGVTTAALSGTVVDDAGKPLPGATVVATHVPSGTVYGTTTRANGEYNLPNLRVGGPYTLTVTFVGYVKQEHSDIYLQLGQVFRQDFRMVEDAVRIPEVLVTGERSPILSAGRTGAATSVDRDVIRSFPTISRRIEDFARLTPQYNPRGFGFSFAGQDNRFNNFTVDGAYFNNSFGLAGQPGDRTGVAPISLDAIEQLQINIAPYDVRQGAFVGAGINTVTRGGTNAFSGSVYYHYRHQGLVGTKAKALTIDRGKFNYNQIGLNLGGPVIPNRLFFFVSYEGDGLTSPATTMRANRGGEPVGGNITRVVADTLIRLSNFLREKFGYETGPFEGYDHETPARRFLARLDFNLDDRNKLTLRYNRLDSEADILVSNSAALGFGNRRAPFTTALNFRNSNYIIMENIRTVVGEWSSILGANMSNNLIIGYSYHDESRKSRGQFFPMVDILEGGLTYTTFGFEPFTPNNELRYWSYQLQNNFTIYTAKHHFTFGVSLERYESENIFFPGSQSVYTYSSLADFYTDALDYLRNPARTTSPVTLRRFQLRWMNIPGMDKPVQPLKVFYAGVYAQDEWQVSRNLRLTLGLRLDVPFFGKTGYRNALADALSFRDEKDYPVRYETAKLPDPRIHWSPRVGFNWDVWGNRSTQVRGGSGIFTGRPAYVWISNQIGNTGVLTGFESIDFTRARPFNPNPHHYKPTRVTGEPAAAYELALTDPNFKFPQVWRSNIAVDQRLPFGLVGTAEFLYNRDVNGIYYINANLTHPNSRFVGADNRPRWTSPAAAVTRIHPHIANAIVLKNQSVGYSWNVSASLEKPFSDGWFAKVAYNYGEAKNTVSPAAIAFSSWVGNAHRGNPNDPGLGHAAESPGHRVFAALSYRLEYFKFGATTVSLFWEGANIGRASYVFGGDMNNDGGVANDLIYIPRDTSEMNFEPYTITFGGVTRTFSRAEQAAAWEAFIKQDKYLSKNRGKYAERNGVLLPMLYRADLSIVQDVFADIFGRRNTLQFRVDILNVGNLLNKNWGVGQRLVTTTPLIPAAARVDAAGRALYRLRAIETATGPELISKSLEQTAGIGDVWRIQLSVRYIFN